MTTINDLITDNEKFRDALQKIKNWSEAYPLEVFPEADLKRARELLQAGGIAIDSISAAAMRHVINGVGEIAKKALGE
jgi:hypothetical protein